MIQYLGLVSRILSILCNFKDELIELLSWTDMFYFLLKIVNALNFIMLTKLNARFYTLKKSDIK